MGAFAKKTPPHGLLDRWIEKWDSLIHLATLQTGELDDVWLRRSP
jgi:hypothetical protein